jgi:hypothetical protein
MLLCCREILHSQGTAPPISQRRTLLAIKDRHHHESSWYIQVLIAVATVVILYIVFRLARTYVGGIKHCCSRENPLEPTSQDGIKLETPSTTQQTTDNSEPETVEPTPQARFVKYRYMCMVDNPCFILLWFGLIWFGIIYKWMQYISFTFNGCSIHHTSVSKHTHIYNM